MKSLEGACVELIEAPKFEVGLYSVGTDVNDLDETIEYLKKMDATYWRTCKYNSWTSSFYKKSKWYQNMSYRTYPGIQRKIYVNNSPERKNSLGFNCFK